MWARRVALGIVLAGALYALVFDLRLPSVLPSEQDHRAAAAWLSQQAQPGDVLLLFPWWTDRARAFAPSQVPVVGYLGSDSADLEEHPRIWVLSQPRLPRSDVSGFERAFLPGRTRVGEPQRSGPLELTLYTNGRHRPVLFSTAAAGRPPPWSVFVESPDGARTPCAWDGGAHRCGGAFVTAPEWHEVFYRPLQCLYLHPPGGPSRLVVDFQDVPWGERFALEAGVIWEHAPRKGGGQTPIRVGLESAGQRLLFTELQPGQEGLDRKERPSAGLSPGPLQLWLQSDGTEDRDVCVNVKSLGAAAP
jgi:hypothetical protein